MFSLEFIVPFYGSPGYLFQGITRLQSLSDVRWRLTIVDDAMPGAEWVGTAVEELCDERIRYFRNQANLGISLNVQECIRLAEWDFVVLSGFDDMVLPNYGRVIERLSKRYPHACVMQSGVRVVDENGAPAQQLADRVKRLARPRGKSFELQGESAASSLLRGNWLYASACCFTLDALKGAPFREGMDSAHDLALVVDALTAGGSLAYDDETAFEYRRHSGSFSSTLARSGRRFAEERAYFAVAADELESLGWTRAAREARRHVLSRLNAASQLPGAARARDGDGARAMVGHVFGRG